MPWPTHMCRRDLHRRRLFDHGMGVGAAEAERTDAGEARFGSPLPISSFCGHDNRIARPRDVRARLLEMEMGGNAFVLKRENHLHHTDDTGGRLQVSDVRL